jgi:hypothetical protein
MARSSSDRAESDQTNPRTRPSGDMAKPQHNTGAGFLPDRGAVRQFMLKKRLTDTRFDKRRDS